MIRISETGWNCSLSGCRDPLLGPRVLTDMGSTHPRSPAGGRWAIYPLFLPSERQVCVFIETTLGHLEFWFVSKNISQQ